MRERTRNAALALVACLAAAALGTGARPVAADETPVDTARLSVGSYNINGNTSPQEWSTAVEEVWPSVDILGVQEVGQGKLAALREESANLGYGYSRPRGQGNATMWRDDRFELVDTSRALLTPKRYVGDEAIGRHFGYGAYVPPETAVVVHLRERATGRLLSVLNVHLLASCVRNGRPIPGYPKLFRAYRASVIRLGQLVRRERSFGQVFVIGDFNVGFVQDRNARRYHLPYRTFRRQGMPSMWAAQQPPAHRGSQNHGHALVDQIYTSKRATTAVAHYEIQHSDHYPVIATYHLPTPAPSPASDQQP